MGAFLTNWLPYILIAVGVLAVLSLAEWRDHRDGLYEDEPDEPDPYPDLSAYEDTLYEDDEHETYGWEQHNPYA